MDFVTTKDGTRLFVRSQGSGPPVVIPYGISLGFDALADSHTIIFYDPRNRGFSDPVPGNIELDVEDLDDVRRELGHETIALLGHSYLGLLSALYAIRHPDRVSRALLIGPEKPRATTQYPPHLAYQDAVVPEIFGKLKAYDPTAPDPVTRFWNILRPMYVLDPAHASRVRWERPDAPRELGFMAYWLSTLLPSLQRLSLTDADFARATAPVLVIHGRQDRSAPYGGGREWAMRLQNARLVTAENSAHAPWLEHPEAMWPLMRQFLGGEWPAAAEKVTSLEP